MPSQKPIAAGKRIKLPAALLNRFENEVDIANRILKERKKRRKKQTNAATELNIRSRDLERFTTRKAALRYLRTTHDIITGKFFEKQISLYRANLIESFFKSWGIDPGETRLNVFNLKNYKNQLSQEQYDLAITIATLTKEQADKLSQYGNINLIRYNYTPPENDSNIKYVIDILNKKGAVFEEANQFDKIQQYRRLKRL